MEIPAGSSRETERLKELKKYHIVDTLSEQEYDDITLMASLICQAPVSLISFVEGERQWFKSSHGSNLIETPRAHSFCAHSIGVPEKVLVVKDARNDERFKANPLVTGDPNIVFYAGAPLVTSSGFGLGSVCVIDTKPRELSAAQEQGLQVLARQVMQLLETRKKDIDLQVSKLQVEIRNKDLEQFAMILAHDIKTPLSSVMLSNQSLSGVYAAQLDQHALKMVDISFRAANKITGMVNDILSFYKNGSGEIQYREFDLAELFDSLTALSSHQKNTRLPTRISPER